MKRLMRCALPPAAGRVVTRVAPGRRAQGFSLIVTIFVIVVLAALGAFAVRIAETQQQSVDFGLLDARAQAAAASGIQYGANMALKGGSCPLAPVAFPLAAAGLAGFTVTVTCSASTHMVSGSTCPGFVCTSYALTAVAEYGTYGQPDFVQATQSLSVNNAPP
jgi:MSHA biogenesis protein MshP